MRLQSLKTALVTGNSGFVGSHLVDKLRAHGVAVTGLSASGGFDITRDDLPLADVEHVFHLAGRTYVPEAWDDPVGFYEANAFGTVRILDQCRRRGVGATYVSAYVYGPPLRLPISEADEPRPNNPYAFAKLAGEEACRFFSSTFSMQVSILRLFNVYGAGQRDDFLIPTIARQVLDPSVATIEVADLTPRRDFVHVDDVVEAMMLSRALPAGEPFNVGSGVSRSVEDIIVACMSAAGVDKAYRSRNETRANEVNDVVADISAIRNAVGWSPRTGFEDGIASVIARARNV